MIKKQTKRRKNSTKPLSILIAVLVMVNMAASGLTVYASEAADVTQEYVSEDVNVTGVNESEDVDPSEGDGSEDAAAADEDESKDDAPSEGDESEGADSADEDGSEDAGGFEGDTSERDSDGDEDGNDSSDSTDASEDSLIETEAEEEDGIQESVDEKTQIMLTDKMPGNNEVSDFISLKEAVNNAEDNTETEITVSENIEFPETLVVPVGKIIVLKTKENTTAVFSPIGAAKSKALIQVDEGASLTLDGDITLDCSSGGRWMKVKGSLVVENGTMTGGSPGYGESGIEVSGESASFVLNNGVVEKLSSGSVHSSAICIKDNASAVINGGTIRNNSFSNQFCGTVTVDNAQLEMNDGEISDNKGSGQLNTTGGVLVIALVSNAKQDNAKNSSFEMNGGKISNNEGFRGGGVYVYGGSAIYDDYLSKASFTMNGGEISGNKTYNAYNYEAAGGGVFVEWAGEFTMNDGEIKDNYTQRKGGGVAVSDNYTNYFGTSSYDKVGDRKYKDITGKDWPEVFPAAFTMNGGSITGNKASGSCGGGVYIASNNVVLNAGDISDNKSGSQGGGVYVSSVPYTLKLSNALITENTASVIGGGLWFCPTGEVKISVNNGTAVYNNTAQGAADDFAAVHSNGSYMATLSDCMLGGGAANWYQDGGIDPKWTLGYANTDVQRYNADGDDNIPVSDISASRVCLSLKSVPSRGAQKLAESMAELKITGNSSGRGGGIGSNGTVEIGDAPDKTRELTINKKWFGSDDLPDTVKVWIVINNIRSDEVVLTKDENWTKTIKGLPIDDEIEFAVEEEVPDKWHPSYDYKVDEDGNVIADITNTKDDTETPPDGHGGGEGGEGGGVEPTPPTVPESVKLSTPAVPETVILSTPEVPRNIRLSSPSVPRSMETGDDGLMPIYCIIMLASIGALIIWIRKRQF